MTKVCTIIHQGDDPLGYDGDVVTRVRAMAKDALAGVNEDAVAEEAAILRPTLRLAKKADNAEGT